VFASQTVTRSEGRTTNVDDRIVGRNGYTLEYYDAAKQSLDDRFNTLLARGSNGEARELIAVRDRLVGILDNAVPSYAPARGTASTFFGASNALEAGESFATAGARYENQAARYAFSEMTDAEQTLFREGYISRLISAAEELGDRRDLVGMIANNSPATRERLEMVLGPVRARQVETYLHVENLMELGRKEIMGGSPTTRFLKGLGLIGDTSAAGGIGAGLYTGDPATASWLLACSPAAVRSPRWASKETYRRERILQARYYVGVALIVIGTLMQMAG
jgi:hypothetical protein